MSAQRLTVKFYRSDYPPEDMAVIRWHDVVAIPRVGDYVAPAGITTQFRVAAVTWVSSTEVNVTITPRGGGGVLARERDRAKDVAAR